MRIRASILGLLVAACGGAGTAHDTTPEPCAEEDAALSTATEALRVCRETAPEPWSHGPSYDALLAQLGEYETSLAFGDDGNEATAQAIAASAWSFFDELAGEVVDHHPLDVAEDAAEALLRDRDHDHALEAIAAARAAFVALHDLYAAPTAPDCSDEEADESDARAARGRCS